MFPTTEAFPNIAGTPSSERKSVDTSGTTPNIPNIAQWNFPECLNLLAIPEQNPTTFLKPGDIRGSHYPLESSGGTGGWRWLFATRAGCWELRSAWVVVVIPTLAYLFLLLLNGSCCCVTVPTVARCVTDCMCWPD
ncbi:unnamed protein product [Onchocerca ochengi]|uniref:Uncharacterized protein n=1 Tax=Onchocerca ochengi TaxID=42157 RepID=A0A182ES02_ONCOC|nr:unnamed protein product [Onchocerca ochengi]